MKKFNVFTMAFLFVLFFLEISAYARVQDIYGRYVEVKKIKIIRVAEPPQYYELDNKKYTLRSLEEYVKNLEETGYSTMRITWMIEIEKPESYETIEELVNVLKYFKGSGIKVSPAGYEE